MTEAQLTLRKNTYRRIRSLSDGEISRVLDLIDTFEDDETLSDDELAQIEASNDDIAAGRVSQWEDVKRRLASRQ